MEASDCEGDSDLCGEEFEDSGTGLVEGADPVLSPLQGQEELPKDDGFDFDFFSSQVVSAEPDDEKEPPASQSSSVIAIEESPGNQNKREDLVQSREEIQDKINEVSMMLNNARKKMASQCFSWIVSKLFVLFFQKGFPPTSKYFLQGYLKTLELIFSISIIFQTLNLGGHWFLLSPKRRKPVCLSLYQKVSHSVV